MKRWVKWFIAGGVITIIATLVADIFLPIDMRVAANVSLVYMAIATTAFAVGYAVRSNWSNSWIGPVYLGYKATMALVLWQIVIAVWASNDWPGRQHTRFVIYSLGVIAAVVWAATLREAQRIKTLEAELPPDVPPPPLTSDEP